MLYLWVPFVGLGRRRKREDGSGKQAVLTCSGASWSALAEGNQAIASSEGGFLQVPYFSPWCVAEPSAPKRWMPAVAGVAGQPACDSLAGFSFPGRENSPSVQ